MILNELSYGPNYGSFCLTGFCTQIQKLFSYEASSVIKKKKKDTLNTVLIGQNHETNLR